MTQQPDPDEVAANMIRAFFQFKKLHREENHPSFDPHRPMHGLKGSEVMLLFVLSDAVRCHPEGITVSQLSKILGVRPPSITPVLAKLEEKEMLERTMDKNDRRIVRVRMRDKGRELIREHKRHMVQRFRGLVEYLGVEKSVALTDLINEAFTYIKKTYEHGGQ